MNKSPSRFQLILARIFIRNHECYVQLYIVAFCAVMVIANDKSFPEYAHLWLRCILGFICISPVFFVITLFLLLRFCSDYLNEGRAYLDRKQIESDSKKNS